jgi:DedD protein
MADSHDVNTLKRRGRRRLVGAIALVLVAVIVLPWIFEPKPVPKPPPAEAVKPAPAPDAAPVKPEAKPAEKAAAAQATPAPVSAERARAEAALANVQYVVPVGAYADPAGVIAKLKSAKLAYFTEPVATAKGTVTRVRAGPFASREAAEKAHKQLKSLGFAPGNIASRS